MLAGERKEDSMTKAHIEVIRVMAIWRQFKKEFGQNGLYANVLWLWPGYLRDNS